VKTLASILVLFAIISIISISPSAFAEVTITTGPVALSAPGCEETDECYTPSTTTVDVGGVVTMTNIDSTGIHTFTSGTVDGFTPSPDSIFDSGILNADQSFEWIPETSGEYPYYCMLHTWMQGSITVN
jgi:plastocyanin